jgi:single-stranded-DNA-specific exonuclease
MEEIIENKTIYQLKNLTKKQKKDSDALKESGVHPIMAELYALRGVENFNDINLVQRLEPYTNMKGAKEAAKILAQAILRKEKICVIADYDVDGATACTVAVRGLKMFGANVDYVVPDRFIHGYGLTPSVVDEAIQRKNPDLLVTVDNGIASVEGVDYANKKGLKVLVTDHHLAGDTIPDALCIVNPNQPGCEFKNKSLAGCGVMFYVLAALRQHMIDLEVYNAKTVPNVFSLLDLVAIGTIADLVKLELNNRIIVSLGLGLIKKKQTRPGVLAIIEVAKSFHNKLSTTDIGFRLGPRINAAGRLEDMSIGINCLLTDNPDTAKKLAEKLNEINVNRRKLEGEMKEQALELPSLKETKFSKVAYDASFHEGVIGIVASRIKELFYRPTIVFAPAHEDSLIKGSGRSIPEIHLRDALDYVYKKRPDIIVKFGGHAMAAGLTIKKDLLQDFCDLFEEAVEHFADGRELQNVKQIDLDLPAKYINVETTENIRNEIWGQGFPQPLFVGEFHILDQKILKEAHLKLTVEKEGKVFEGIWFNQNTMLETDTVKLIYSLDLNDFRDQIKVQLMIEGIYED